MKTLNVVMDRGIVAGTFFWRWFLRYPGWGLGSRYRRIRGGLNYHYRRGDSLYLGAGSLPDHKTVRLWSTQRTGWYQMNRFNRSHLAQHTSTRRKIKQWGIRYDLGKENKANEVNEVLQMQGRSKFETGWLYSLFRRGKNPKSGSPYLLGNMLFER